MTQVARPGASDPEAPADAVKGWCQKFLLIVPFIVCIAITCTFVGLSSVRSPTIFEISLFQLAILASGLFGSYIFGKNSSLAAARELISPHARSAFRRVTALYDSLQRLSIRIEELKEGVDDHRLTLVQALVDEQIWTGHDAMEDWRDIVPDEVAKVRRRNVGNAETD